MSKTEWTSNRQARPEAAGDYLVTLEWPEADFLYSDNKVSEIVETGRMHRDVTQRDYDRPGEYAGWEMEGEDPEDYHWAEQIGSAWHEHVVAWMGPIEPPEAYREELADGYEYVWEDAT